MFERLNESARAAIVAAEEIAVELNSQSIDIGHLLYGLAEGREDTAGKPLNDHRITAHAVRQLLPHSNAPVSGGVDAESLRAIGVDYNGVRAAVEKTFGEGALDSAADRRGGDVVTKRPRFTVEAKKSLEQAMRVSEELHTKVIMPGHLLLGLLRVDDDFISNVIARSTTSIAGLSASVFGALARPIEP
jgi:ATP-dependent Clp protease ATP-binding subunit ClpA